MAIFNHHPISRREIMLVFAACAFPIYSWAIFHFLEKMSGWLYYLTIWELLSILAYTLAFALVESVAVLAGLLLLAVLLPARLVRRNFVAVSTVLVLLMAAWFMGVQYNDATLKGLSRPFLALLMAVGAASFLLAYLAVQRSERWQARVNAFAERLSVLLYLYLPLSLLSLLIIAARNL